jgi:hypothetical protein
MRHELITFFSVHKFIKQGMKKIADILKGGDLRSIGQSNKIVSLIDNQGRFDELFQQLFHPDRKVVMRSADVIEKITLKNPGFLRQHKASILKLIETAKHIELKWHLALIVSRMNLSKKEFEKIWQTLTGWASDKKESKIVRVNSIQGLFNLLQTRQELKQDFNLTISQTEKENIPSLNARIKKLKNAVR